MITANFKAYASYVTDSLHQWDTNQVLQVSGLNLTTVPEVHFSNANTARAIPRQATMNAAGVVAVGVPNSLLQDPLRIYAHIGIYEGDTFKVVELVEIPVIPRKRPADYQIQDSDEEIYSFKALENAVANMVTKRETAAITARIDTIVAHNNSTEGNTELVDIRTGAGGEKYSSAGTAVREQISAIRKAQVNPNLMNEYTFTPGYLDAYGALAKTNDKHYCYCSDFIPVDSALPYYWHAEHPVTYGETPWVGLCTYDKDKNFIERLSWHVAERAITFDAKVFFVRVSFRSLMLGRGKFEQSTYPTAIEALPESRNLAEVYPLEFPGYINAGGYINTQTPAGASGIVLAEHFSKMLPVSAGETIVLYNGTTYDPWAAVGFYGGDGLPIKREPFTTDEKNTFTVTVPEGAVAMRYSARTYAQHSFICYKQTGHNDYMADYLQLTIEHRTRVTTQGSALVKAVAHRGYSSGAPENTLPAYRLAKKNGFEYAECDISFTSDNVAVLLHDNTIDRTSDGSGSVSSMTYAGLLAYDFGSWYGDAFTGTKIPTAEEFLQLCRNIGLKPYIELKAGNEAQIVALVKTVKKYGLQDVTTWISFNAAYLTYVKNTYSRARLGFVMDGITAAAIKTAKGLQTGENEVFIDSGSYTDAEVELCIEADLPLEIWTVNSAATIQALPAYVSGVTSDSQHAGKVLCSYGMN